MRIILLFTLSGWLWSVSLFSQITVPAPLKQDFAGTMGFLSSGWMQGREAGSRESFMAADYLLSQMMQLGLQPGNGAGYFQDFDIVRYQSSVSSLRITTSDGKSLTESSFVSGRDFVVDAGPQDFSVRASMVFAGHGIVAPEAGIDDYHKLNVAGSVVVVLDGFPYLKKASVADPASIAPVVDESLFSLKSRRNHAFSRGAKALIVICSDKKLAEYNAESGSQVAEYPAFTTSSSPFPAYTDHFWALPDDQTDLPVYYISQRLAALILGADHPVFAESEKTGDIRKNHSHGKISNREIQLSATYQTERLSGRNVLGLIRGTDTSRCVVIGAHYDHLGQRNGLVYHGSDDNASGVAGMLALAAAWKRAGVQPPVNLLFAAWAGEEKGHLGSRYFTGNHDYRHTGILLNLNFDMISRSDEADTTRNILSIGMLQGSNDLRQMAMMENSRLNRPFKLDLWETMGGGGSDYAAFSLRKIPVMSFFTGFHQDYHSPGDTFAKADLEKMEAVLQLANRLLVAYLSLIIR